MFYGLKLLSKDGIQKMSEIGFAPFLLILFTSLLVSFFVAHLYLRFYGQRATGSSLHRSFPLIGVSITAIFISLQFSIPLSLGLLGALSIVRFRTPIKDPEEVGFILLLIATSLACATFNLPFLGILMSIALLGLIILKKDVKLFRKTKFQGTALIRIPRDIYLGDMDYFNLLAEKKLELGVLESVIDQDITTVLSFNLHEVNTQKLGELKKELLERSEKIQMDLYSNISHK
ncbi:DUF4956 domain-containing protein [Bacteriovoracaceae bacterium]|nr:DUF4956 domain-containing protein [Bacteriovoracaceae bacterium]